MTDWPTAGLVALYGLVLAYGLVRGLITLAKDHQK